MTTLTTAEYVRHLGDNDRPRSDKDEWDQYVRGDAAKVKPRVPLTEVEIERLRNETFSTSNPFCPVDRKSMIKAVRAAEQAHGITEEKK